MTSTSSLPAYCASKPNRILLLLIGMVVLSVLETDLYLASFPQMAAYFHVSESIVQSSLNIYLLFFAIGILLVGPVSDRLGKKKVFLSCLGLDLAGTFCILLSTTNEVFLLGRILQALGGCAGTVLGRVIVRELYQGDEAKVKLAYLFTGVAIAIALTPITGGIVETAFGWKANFLLLSFYQVLLWLGIFLCIPETNAYKTTHLKWKDLLGNFMVVLTMQPFRYFGGLITLAWSGFFTFVGSVSFLLSSQFSINPAQFGLLFALMVSGMILGTVFSGKIVRKWTVEQSMFLAALLFILSGTTLCFFTYLSCVFFCLSIFIYLLALGILLPLCQAGATENGKHLTSSMFSLIYFWKMLGAALAGFACSFFPIDMLPYFMALFCFANVVVFIKMKRLYLFTPLKASK